MGIKTVKYDVWGLDVWGNSKDGFTVNDRRCFQRGMEFPTTHKVYNEGMDGEFSGDWPTNKQIVQTLKKIGFLKKGIHTESIAIEGESDSSLYLEQSKDGFPICKLDYVE